MTTTTTTTTTMTWAPTHRIVYGRDQRVVLVQLCADEDGAGPAYTRGEWDDGAAADWERDAEGTWTFQGRVAPGVGALVVEALVRSR